MSRFISQMMQDRAIVTMEGELETTPKLSNDTGLNDLEWPLPRFQGHDITQCQITQKWYKIELYLQ